MSAVSTRLLDVYVSLAARLQGATPTDLAKQIGIPETEATACIETLVQMQFAEPDPQYAWRYRLGSRSAPLGSAGRFVEIRTLAWPMLQELHGATQRRVSLHIIDGHLHRAIDICPRVSQAQLRAEREVGYRDGRILRFGATAIAILAFMPEAEAARALAATADPPAAGDIACHPQFSHLAGVTIDSDYWNRNSPTSAQLHEARVHGYALSRSSIGQAQTAPLFEWGPRVCGGLCVFGEETDSATVREHGRYLVMAAARISGALGHLPGS